MQSDYTFLNDHSYSIRVDYDKLSLKSKKRRGTSNRSNKTKTNNRTVSIDRSSSDKENSLLVPIINPSGHKKKILNEEKNNSISSINKFKQKTK